jgi:hypothetical protein
MPETHGVKISELLPKSHEGMIAKVADQLGKVPPAGGARIAWKFVGEKALEQLHTALDMDVFAVLARGWCCARELGKFKDAEAYPPDRIVTVHLGEHDLPPLCLYPEVQVMFGPFEGPKLRFTLEFTVHIRSVALAIRGARITSVAAGDGLVSVQLKYGEVELHPALESKHVSLSKTLFLPEPGLKIA